MVKILTPSNKKSRAQTMIEFALVLPILLALVYGVLETGRLLFIYASTVTASRQAARYGSATGDNGSGIPYYQDCAGITQAAENVGFINSFSDINITYDGGLDAGGNPQAVDATLALGEKCENITFADHEFANGDRINISVKTRWEPIAPYVPFQAFDIDAESSRTILVSVSIQVTAPVSSLPGTGTGELVLDNINHSPATYDELERVNFTFHLTNPDVDPVDGPFSIVITGATPVIFTSCDDNILPGGGSTNCYGYYDVIQTDLDRGYFDFLAQATSPGPTSDNVYHIVNATQNPQLALIKVGDTDHTAIVGTTIHYTYTLENTGNVTLNFPYTVTDDVARDEFCPSTDPLPPGATTTCTATYDVRQSDIGGRIVNHATATARWQSSTITSNQATWIVYTPLLYLTVQVTPLTVNLAGTIVNYQYFLYNNTDSSDNLNNPYAIATISGRSFPVSCPQSPDPLPAGNTIICSYNYTVTQADMDTGGVITSTIQARYKWRNRNEESNDVTVFFTIVQTPALSLTKTAFPPHDPPLLAGDVVRYDYVLTNSGNVTLKQPFTVSDDKLTGITCSTTDLAPNATKTCTINHTITNDDRQAGSIKNHATASAKFGAQTITSPEVEEIVLVHNQPRLSLQKSANFNGVTGTGQLITYTYTLRNTGDRNLTNISVTDQVVATGTPITVDCSLADDPLPVGETTTCTASYTTVQADVDAGSVTNQAVATTTQATSNTASVSVAVWHLPNAVDDSATTTAGIQVTTSVLTNDDLGRTPTTIISWTNGLNGTVSCTTQCTYTPNPGFTGVDSYSYTIRDANNNSDTATVSVTVSP